MVRRRDGSWLRVLAVLLAFFTCVICFVSANGQRRPADCYDIQIAARKRMQRCMEAVKGYKESLNIPLSAEDIHATGLIGCEYSEITTTIGAIEAKRTAASPDMAALLVRMFYDAGLERGNSVGAGFSGSFPSLNIAVISACDAMGLELTYISSVGASSYGANDTELTFPDMAHRLYADGLISCDSALVTPGGDNDDARGVFDDAVFDRVLERLAAIGIPTMREADYQKNLSRRMALYEANGIDCFVAVGGNITAMGKGDRALKLGQGLLQSRRFNKALIDDNSGLVERYMAKGIPVINLLNIKKIATEYGIAFDPAVLPPEGESEIYYKTRFSKALPMAALVTGAAAMICSKKHFDKRKGGKPH